MRMLLAGAVLSASLIACADRSLVERTEGHSEPERGAPERWKPAGTVSGTVLHIDLGNLRLRSDTLQVRVRVSSQESTMMSTVEVVCATQMFRRERDGDWRSIPESGLPRMVATSACEEIQAPTSR